MLILQGQSKQIISKPKVRFENINRPLEKKQPRTKNLKIYKSTQNLAEKVYRKYMKYVDEMDLTREEKYVMQINGNEFGYHKILACKLFYQHEIAYLYLLITKYDTNLAPNSKYEHKNRRTDRHGFKTPPPIGISNLESTPR